MKLPLLTVVLWTAANSSIGVYAGSLRAQNHGDENKESLDSSGGFVEGTVMDGSVEGLDRRLKKKKKEEEEKIPKLSKDYTGPIGGMSKVKFDPDKQIAVPFTTDSYLSTADSSYIYSVPEYLCPLLTLYTTKANDSGDEIAKMFYPEDSVEETWDYIVECNIGLQELYVERYPGDVTIAQFVTMEGMELIIPDKQALLQVPVIGNVTYGMLLTSVLQDPILPHSEAIFPNSEAFFRASVLDQTLDDPLLPPSQGGDENSGGRKLLVPGPGGSKTVYDAAFTGGTGGVKTLPNSFTGFGSGIGYQTILEVQPDWFSKLIDQIGYYYDYAATVGKVADFGTGKKFDIHSFGAYPGKGVGNWDMYQCVPMFDIHASSTVTILTGGNTDCQNVWKALSDGCSTPEWLKSDFKDTFLPACNRHDLCYGVSEHYDKIEFPASFKSRGKCDNLLLRDLQALCDIHHPGADNGWCKMNALVWYGAVVIVQGSNPTKPTQNKAITTNTSIKQIWRPWDERRMPKVIRYAESFLATPGRIKSMMNGKAIMAPFNSISALQMTNPDGNRWYEQEFVRPNPQSLAIKHLHSDYCLDVYGYAGPGGQVVMYPCNGATNQQWWFDDIQRLHPVHRAGEDLCLDILGASDAVGANLIISQCHGGANQQWFFE